MRGHSPLAALLIAVVAVFLALAPLTGRAAISGGAGMPGGSASLTEAGSSPRHAQTARALRSATRSLQLQTTLPKGLPMREENWRKPPDLPDAPFASQLATYIFWGALAVILLVVLLSLRDNFWSFSRARTLSAAEDEERPDAAASRMGKTRLAADDLARQGGFAEAMHLLLLQSVQELRRRMGVSIAASLTSREILRHIALPPEGRNAFADIIGRVEISYFGQHDPGEEDYRACRASYEALSRALGAGA